MFAINMFTHSRSSPISFCRLHFREVCNFSGLGSQRFKNKKSVRMKIKIFWTFIFYCWSCDLKHRGGFFPAVWRESVALSEHHTPFCWSTPARYFSSFTVSFSGFLTKATTLYPLSRVSKTVCCPEGPLAPNTEIFMLKNKRSLTQCSIYGTS